MGDLLGTMVTAGFKYFLYIALMEKILSLVNRVITKGDYNGLREDVIDACAKDVQYGVIRNEDTIKLFMLKSSEPIERYEVTIRREIQVK